MTESECTHLKLVLLGRDGDNANEATYDLQVPKGAGIDDLLLRLQKESPGIYGEVRVRILESARRILSFGSRDEVMTSLHRGLAEGGTIVFAANDDLTASFYPRGEPENQH